VVNFGRLFNVILFILELPARNPPGIDSKLSKPEAYKPVTFLLAIALLKPP
jgi:hypothetical protein